MRSALSRCSCIFQQQNGVGANSEPEQKEEIAGKKDDKVSNLQWNWHFLSFIETKHIEHTKLKYRLFTHLILNNYCSLVMNQKRTRQTKAN